MNPLQLQFDNDAISIVEFMSIPTGLVASDAAVKAAQVNTVYSGFVHPGKFLLALQGGVYETELAHRAACTAGRDQLIDSIHLPYPHPALRRNPAFDEAETEQSLLAIETLTVPSLFSALDHSLKRTQTTLRFVRWADHLGGKSLAIIEGDLADVEASYQLVSDDVSSVLLADLQMIKRPHRDFLKGMVSSLQPR